MFLYDYRIRIREVLNSHVANVLLCIFICMVRNGGQILKVTEDQFLVSDWGDIVDSGIGLSYRPARLHRLADNIPPVRD
jgi:hypothetical protein